MKSEGLRHLQKFHSAFVKTSHSINSWRELLWAFITICGRSKEITLKSHGGWVFIEIRFTYELSGREGYCERVSK
jgi:hypothetical protein